MRSGDMNSSTSLLQQFPFQRLIVAPSILSANFADLKGELKRLERARCTWVHLDIMDGHFVPNLTIGPPVVKALRKVSDKLFFDAHLMIDNPLKYAPAFADAGTQLLTVHQETLENVGQALKKIRSLGMFCGISVKPKTPISTIEPYLKDLDLVLVMTVEPGFGGQEMMPRMLNKVRRLSLLRQEEDLPFRIQVDGGINEQTAPLAVAAGADVLVAGSYVFAGGTIKQNVERLMASA